MLVTGSSIYVGNTTITQIYQGNDLIWPVGAPAWPKNYFYPTVYPWYFYNGLSFWKDNLVSGQTYTIDLSRIDDEGEGGGGYRTIGTKTGWTEETFESYVSYPLIPHNNYQNVWVNYYDGWTITFHNFGSFDGGTAVAYKGSPSYGGGGCYIPNTGINWDNVELAVNLSEGYTVYDRFGADVVLKCHNLKYISFNINGNNTGSTIILTGSTAWTSESMKFTEWYSPGTTFVVFDNSYWRSIIDWDIAERRNVTFKDTNDNIMHRQL